MVEQYGLARLLEEVAGELRDGTYRPLPARRVFIPKPGTGERRPLSIPAVRDRIVQAAVKIVLEPVFEADMAECSFASLLDCSPRVNPLRSHLGKQRGHHPHRMQQSASEPNVPDSGAPCPVHASVHPAGISVLLPSGSQDADRASANATAGRGPTGGTCWPSGPRTPWA